MLTPEKCLICGSTGCTTYPLMIERFVAGRDREHWQCIHDQINGIESDAARAARLIAEFPPQPTDRRCCNG